MPNLRNTLILVGTALFVAKLISFVLRFSRSRISLRQKIVVLTGASSGLGLEIARKCHAAGAKLILLGRNTQKLAELCTEFNTVIESESDNQSVVKRAVFGELNLAASPTVPDVQKLIQTCLRQLQIEDESDSAAASGGVDILINNAGISVRSSVADTTIATHRQLMEVNYFGQIAVTQAVLPLLNPTGGKSCILVISSVQGKIAIPHRAAYSASKHALQAYFDSLRAELNPRRCQVTVCSPGYIRTNLSRNALTGSGEAHGQLDQATETGTDPERAAAEILWELRRGTQEFILAPIHHRLITYVRNIFPDLFFWIMRRRAVKQQQ